MTETKQQKEDPIRVIQNLLNQEGLRKMCRGTTKLLEIGELSRFVVEGTPIYPPEFYIQVSTDTRDYLECVRLLIIEEKKLISKFAKFGLEEYLMHLSLRPEGGKLDGETFQLLPIDGAIGNVLTQGYFLSELVSILIVPKNNPEKIFKAFTDVDSEIVEQKINH
jgi:hypothetical protein